MTLIFAVMNTVHVQKIFWLLMLNVDQIWRVNHILIIFIGLLLQMGIECGLSVRFSV